MVVTQLSTGCLEAIMSGTDFDKPVLQILGTKKISGGESDRYRLLVSDGVYLNSFAMLATQLNNLQTEGKLAEYTIIRADRYITSMVNKAEKNEKRVLIILDLTVMNAGSEVQRKIGNPIAFDGVTKPAAPAPAKSTSSNTGMRSDLGASVSRPSNGMNAANTSMNSTIGTSLTNPISSLSPFHNKWVIKARVMSKSSIRTWNNAKGKGKLFSMDLMDESGEIRATAFNDAVDKYYDMIEVDKVYFISKCQLKPANKQFSKLNHDYEMSFTSETIVQPCTEDDETDIPQITYNFINISEIAKVEANSNIDVVGICRDVGDLQQFTGRTNNRDYKKRELTLVDMSNAAVQLILWGEDAVNFEGHVQPVILVKNARVTEFGGGKSITLSSSSSMKLNPDIPKSHELRGWFDNDGGRDITNSVSAKTGNSGNFNTEFMTFMEVRQKNLGNGDKPDYFQTKAVIHLIKHSNAFYKACPNADCNKKVISDTSEQYVCEKCNLTSPNFKYRLLLNMTIGDWTSNRWVTCFSEISEQLLGKTADEIGQALEGNEEAAQAEHFIPAQFQSLVFKLRIKMEMYGDMQRSKLTVVSASKVNYKEYNKYLTNNLKEFTGIGSRN